MNKKYIILFVLGFALSRFSIYAQNESVDKVSLKQSNFILLNTITQSTTSITEELIDKNIESDAIQAQLTQALLELHPALVKAPNNANINYKIGLCYYYSIDKQLYALPYFKNAIKNISKNYDFNSSTETGAPHTSYYFLASTFLEANKIDSALYYYSIYKQNGTSNFIDADRDISMCFNAKDLDRNLRDVTVKNIGSVINTTYSERNPVVTIDNKVIFFSSNKPSDKYPLDNSEDIYYSIKEASGKWSAPVAFLYNTQNDESPLFISMDAKTLYFKKTVSGNSDIYFTELNNGIWGKPKPFVEVNSLFNENGFSISLDGKSAYFASDRNKQAGKFDLFVCIKDANGKWGSVQRLPSVINTAFNEVSPFISADGNTLFFSSDGNDAKGCGGYDVYFCERNEKGGWSTPKSMGGPINTTRNDLGYYVAANNKRYCARLNKDKGYDIYVIEGEGFDYENILASTEVITVTQELGVSNLLELEKEIEKEVQITQTIETEVEVEKEVEITKTVETEVEKEVEVTKTVASTDVNDLNVEDLSPAEREILMNKFKTYLAAELIEKQSVSFKTVYFDINQSNLSLLSINELKVLVEFLNEHPETKVEVIGNTDNTGSWQTNLALSNQRAKEVYEFLLKNKVSPERMYYYGRASAVPLVDNTTEKNRSKNRRVEVLILR